LKRILLTASIAAVAAVAVPASAGASTQIGQTISPAGSACNQNISWFQAVSPNNQFVVPVDGVITSWSFIGGTSVPSSMKLKVATIGVTTLSVVAESDSHAPAANVLNTFTSHVPAHAGEVIGFYFPTPNFVPCAATGQGGYTADFASGDLAPGTNNVGFTADPGSHLDLSATLEPDCDGDNLGDETQDTDLSACVCAGQKVTKAGTDGPDQIVGTAGKDVIAALGGNDKVSGLGDADIICGGPGKDTLKGGGGNDKLLGQAGKDTLKGGPGKDKLKGGPGKDKQIQ
jgi:Ca2+-binding RTX toxin-like protein